MMDSMDSQQLLAFLDGELDGVHEEALFRRLATQADLRTEMQDHLAIRKAVQHDAVAFAPPASATAAIFAGLGFTIPPLAPVEGTVTTPGAGGTGWLRRAGLIGGSSAATLLLTLAYLAFVSPSPEHGSAAKSGETARSVPAQTMTPPPTQLMGEDLTAGQPRAGRGTSGTIREAGLIAAARAERMPDTDDLSPATLDPLPQRPLQRPEFQTQVRQLTNETPVMPTGFVLQVRNASARSYPVSSMPSQYDPAITNMSIGVMYRLSDRHALGIEVGQEAFAQQFSGRNGPYAVTYEQNPLAFWATASYRLTAESFVSTVLVPFVQVDLGGALQIGPLGRAYAGFEIRPVQNIAFLLGVEGSVLYYRFQNQWFNTQKLGLTYGLSYGF